MHNVTVIHITPSNTVFCCIHTTYCTNSLKFSTLKQNSIQCSWAVVSDCHKSWFDSNEMFNKRRFQCLETDSAITERHTSPTNCFYPDWQKEQKMLFSNIRPHTLHLCSYRAHLTQTKRVHYVLLCKYSISTRVHNTSTNNANLTPPTRFLLHR